MKNQDYKKYIISRGGEELGLAYPDIQEHLLTPAQFKRFQEYMSGQTVMGIGDTTIVYTGDFEGFIDNLQVTD